LASRVRPVQTVTWQEAVWQQNQTYRAEIDCGGSYGSRRQIWTQSEPDEVDDEEQEVIED